MNIKNIILILLKELWILTRPLLLPGLLAFLGWAANSVFLISCHPFYLQWSLPALLFLLGLSGFLSYRLFSINKLTLFRNVCIDKMDNIYCPQCKLPLIKNFDREKGGGENISLYKCSKCNAYVYLTIAHGEFASLEMFIDEYHKNKVPAKKPS